MAHFLWCNILLWSPPPSFSSPERHIDPLSGEPCVSSIRIIPGGIGFPLLPCSWEPCSCPFLILPALPSQWHWARPVDKGPFVLCLKQKMKEMELGVEEMSLKGLKMLPFLYPQHSPVELKITHVICCI